MEGSKLSAQMRASWQSDLQEMKSFMYKTNTCICVYIYIYTYIHTYIYIGVYIYIYIYTYVYTHMYTYIHIYLCYAYACIESTIYLCAYLCGHPGRATSRISLTTHTAQHVYVYNISYYVHVCNTLYINIVLGRIGWSSDHFDNSSFHSKQTYSRCFK